MNMKNVLFRFLKGQIVIVVQKKGRVSFTLELLHKTREERLPVGQGITDRRVALYCHADNKED